MTVQDTTTKYDGYARGGALVTPQWLEEHLLDPALRVVEVDVSPAAYDAGHIDGAVQPRPSLTAPASVPSWHSSRCRQNIS